MDIDFESSRGSAALAPQGPQGLTTRLLLAAAFVNSLAFGILFVAFPYLGIAIRCKTAEIGTAGGLYNVVYAAGLIVAGGSLGILHPRTQILSSAGLLMLCTIALSMCRAIELLYGIMAVYGLASIWLWPPLMGWLSSGRDGPALNKLLGQFNASWSLGLIAGPLVSGVLYTWGKGIGREIEAPFWGIAACHLLGGVLVYFASGAPVPHGGDEQAVDQIDAGELVVRDRFRAAARVSLVMCYVGTGMMRYPLPGLANSLGIDQAGFGPISLTFSAGQSLGFMALALTAAWHYRRGLWMVLHLLMPAALLVLSQAHGRFGLIAGSLMAGIAVSFAYASHLFYGVSGRPHRARRMGLHELLLSLGFVTGSIGGGLLADALGLRMPFVIAAGLIFVGGVATSALVAGSALFASRAKAAP